MRDALAKWLDELLQAVKDLVNVAPPAATAPVPVVAPRPLPGGKAAKR